MRELGYWLLEQSNSALELGGTQVQDIYSSPSCIVERGSVPHLQEEEVSPMWINDAFWKQVGLFQCKSEKVVRHRHSPESVPPPPNRRRRTIVRSALRIALPGIL